MSIEQAKELVDTVIEHLVEKGFVTQDKYGNMPEHFRETLAEKVIEKYEE